MFNVFSRPLARAFVCARCDRAAAFGANAGENFLSSDAAVTAKNRVAIPAATRRRALRARDRRSGFGFFAARSTAADFFAVPESIPTRLSQSLKLSAMKDIEKNFEPLFIERTKRFAGG